MSEETIMKFKLATLVTIAMGLVSLVVTVMGLWVGFIHSEVNFQGKAIATLNASTAQHNETLNYIRSTIDDIRDDQIRRKDALEKDTEKFLKRFNR